jgi:hypothetical protein
MPRYEDHLPFDPPVTCQHPLMWLLARWLLEAHVRGADGLCCLCRPAEPDPCPARRLAAAGLRTACGHVDGPSGAAWLDVVRRRLTAGVAEHPDVATEMTWALQQWQIRQP